MESYTFQKNGSRTLSADESRSRNKQLIFEELLQEAETR